MKFLLYLAIIAVTAWVGWFTHPQITGWMQERIDSRKSAKQKEIDSEVNKRANETRFNSNGSSKAGDLFAQIGKGQPDPANPSTTTAVTPKPAEPVVANTKPPDPATAPPA